MVSRAIFLAHPSLQAPAPTPSLLTYSSGTIIHGRNPSSWPDQPLQREASLAPGREDSGAPSRAPTPSLDAAPPSPWTPVSSNSSVYYRAAANMRHNPSSRSATPWHRDASPDSTQREDLHPPLLQKHLALLCAMSALLLRASSTHVERFSALTAHACCALPTAHHDYERLTDNPGSAHLVPDPPFTSASYTPAGFSRACCASPSVDSSNQSAGQRLQPMMQPSMHVCGHAGKLYTPATPSPAPAPSDSDQSPTRFQPTLVQRLEEPQRSISPSRVPFLADALVGSYTSTSGLAISLGSPRAPQFSTIILSDRATDTPSVPTTPALFAVNSIHSSDARKERASCAPFVLTDSLDDHQQWMGSWTMPLMKVVAQIASSLHEFMAQLLALIAVCRLAPSATLSVYSPTEPLGGRHTTPLLPLFGLCPPPTIVPAHVGSLLVTCVPTLTNCGTPAPSSVTNHNDGFAQPMPTTMQTSHNGFNTPAENTALLRFSLSTILWLVLLTAIGDHRRIFPSPAKFEDHHTPTQLGMLMSHAIMWLCSLTKCLPKQLPLSVLMPCFRLEHLASLARKPVQHKAHRPQIPYFGFLYLDDATMWQGHLSAVPSSVQVLQVTAHFFVLSLQQTLVYHVPFDPGILKCCFSQLEGGNTGNNFKSSQSNIALHKIVESPVLSNQAPINNLQQIFNKPP